MKLLPFDLQRALAGDKVVTRDGREVTQLHFFDLPNADYPVFGVMNNEIHSWPKNGQIRRDGIQSNGDLFMAPKTVKRWVNFYPTDCFGYLSEEDAKTYAYKNALAIAVPVEFEEGYGRE